VINFKYFDVVGENTIAVVAIAGASGGFADPFLCPDYKWDFRFPRVESIDGSGHTFGHVAPEKEELVMS